MPIVKVEMFEGRSKEQKAKLSQALTDAVVDVTGASPEAVWVVIDDVKKDNWAFGGQLASDKFPD